MPRSRGRSAAPAPRTQTRQSHTMTAPRTAAPAAAPQAVQQQRQPGLFSQMASTAAGVAVGSAMGHTIASGVSSLFGGGGSAAPAYDEAQPLQQQASQPLQQSQAGQCEFDARGLTECLESNSGDMRVCQWYMDQLKSCLNASSGH